MADQHAIPVAVLQPKRRLSWLWIVPALALLFAAWLGYQAWNQRGIPITIFLDDGYGLKAGDDVRYRGITVGRIESVVLTRDLSGVTVTARLTAGSKSLARAGTRFWVVRPQVQLTRVEGLETLVGPRYLAAQPAIESGDEADANSTSTARQQKFVGLSAPPLIDLVQPGDLEVTLQATQRGSLRAGAPVSYRQTRIGTILSVGLNSDGSAVEARTHIEQPFVTLIRPGTRFWDVGGIQAKLGLSGLSLDIDSAESLIAGGVALATPPPDKAGGEIVRTGHRFRVASKPEEEWLNWQPMVSLGSTQLPPGVVPPTPLRASIGWRKPRIMKVFGGGERSIQGWVLQTSEGVLGPADLLIPSDRADEGSAALEVAGLAVPLIEPPLWERNGLAVINANVSDRRWPSDQQRTATVPEECLLFADSGAEPMPLAASRLSIDQNRWVIDPALAFNRAWHGACVVSRTDGKLLGLLLVGPNGRGTVALLQ